VAALACHAAGGATPSGAGDQPPWTELLAQGGQGEPVQPNAVAAAQRQRHPHQQRRRRQRGRHRQRQQRPGRQEQHGGGQPSHDEDPKLPGGQAGQDPVRLVDIGGDAHALHRPHHRRRPRTGRKRLAAR